MHVQASETVATAIAEDIEYMVAPLPGVRTVKVHVVPTTLFDGHMR